MSLFGDLFDFNGDGIATPEEEILGMMMVDEMMAEEQKRRRRDESELDLDLSDDYEDEDDEDDFRAGIRASAEEIDRRTGATRLGKVKAFISLFVAVILVVLATMVVMDLTDYVGSTERIKMGDLGKVIATAEAIEIETLAPPSEE